MHRIPRSPSNAALCEVFNSSNVAQEFCYYGGPSLWNTILKVKVWDAFTILAQT